MSLKLKNTWFQVDCDICHDPDVVEMCDKLGDCAGFYYISILGLMRKKKDLRLKHNVRLIARSIGIEKKSKVEIIRQVL